MLKLDEDVRMVLIKSFVTRYSPLKGPKIPMFNARKYVPVGPVLQWGRVQIAEGGDRACCRKMIKPGAVGRDCTYVRVRLFIINSIYCLMCHRLNSTKRQLTGMRTQRTNGQTWYWARSLENFNRS